MHKFWLESKNGKYGDFPFYNGEPMDLSWIRWIVWTGLTILAFLFFSGELMALFGLPETMKLHIGAEMDQLVSFIFVFVFVLVLIGLFWIVSAHQIQTLFRRIRLNEVLFGIIGGPAALLVIGLYSNYVIEGLFGIHLAEDAGVQMTASDAWSSLFSTVFQLLGEEFGAIVPFLFILMICHKKFHWNRNLSIWIAWIFSSVIFGLYHLSAYNNQWTQVILVIAVSRMLLTIPYIRYKNIWASYLMHLCYDLLPLLSVLIKALMK